MCIFNILIECEEIEIKICLLGMCINILIVFLYLVCFFIDLENDPRPFMKCLVSFWNDLTIYNISRNLNLKDFK